MLLVAMGRTLSSKECHKNIFARLQQTNEVFEDRMPSDSIGSASKINLMDGCINM